MLVPRLPVFLSEKTWEGLTLTYYVADLARDPQPIQIMGFVEAEASS